MISAFVLVPIFAYAIGFKILFNKTVSTSIFFSITSIITILFVFGMVELLQFSGLVLYYGGIIALVFFGIKHTKAVLEFIKSLPAVIYILASVVYLSLMGDGQLFFWDEFSHWGVHAKEMFYFNHLYDNQSISAHPRYLPGAGIWQYFVLLPFAYTEGSLYFAHFLILFSSLLMMYEKLSYNQLHWVAFIFIAQMVLFASFGHWLSSIYVGHVMGALFAGVILSFLIDKYKPFELFLFLFPLIAMVLVKDIGLFFGLSFLGLVVLLLIAKNKIINNETLISSIKQLKYIVLILGSMFIVLILVLKLWGLRQDNIGVAKESQSISSMIKGVLEQSNEDIKTKDTINKRFLQVVLYQQLHKEELSLNYNEFSYSLMPLYKKTIKLSTVGVFFFFLFMCFIAWRVSVGKYQKTQISIIALYLLFVGIVYIGILYLVSTLAFGSNGLRIPSYVRYANMISLPLMIVAFSLFLPMFQPSMEQKSKQKNTPNQKQFLSFVLILFVLVLIVRPYLKPLYSQSINPFKKQAQLSSDVIIKQLPPKSKIYVELAIPNNGMLNIILRYSLIPLRAVVDSSELAKKSYPQMLDIYKKYDYVWFAKINKEIFDKHQGNLIKMKNQRELYTLYKVNVVDNKVSFSPIL